MNKKNNKKSLLKEEVNRFKNILENSFLFYEDEDTQQTVDDLLLSNVKEEDEELDIPDEDINIPGEEESEDEPLDDSEDTEGFGDDEVGFGDEDSVEEPEMESMDDSVELDVTELVKGSEEAKASADSANQKIDQLMGMIDNLENQVTSMSSISTKIDSLESELEKRAPTPNEKLEMISMDSAPFNMRLGDFWKDQEGQYDVMSSEKKETEYVLDKKEIEKDYSDDKLKDSFIDKNEFEEEDF